VLRGVLWELDLPGWEAHPTRRRADVWRALKTAIRWCSRRTGGWSVAGQSRVARATVPPSRQWLEWLPQRAS
jgi:trehalose utilization protein